MTSTYTLPTTDENEYIEAFADAVQEGFENVYGDEILMQVSYTDRSGDGKIRDDLSELDEFEEIDYDLESFHLYSFDESVHATFTYDQKLTGNELHATLELDESQEAERETYEMAMELAATEARNTGGKKTDDSSFSKTIQALINPLTS